ncbi:MAG: RelA/SpoT family protein [Mangrovibacterium sp.]
MKQSIETVWNKLLELTQDMNENDKKQLHKAFQLAHDTIGDKMNSRGKSVLAHAIDVACIVAQEIGLGIDSIISSLLHNVPYLKAENTPTINELEKEFGVYVGAILRGMEKINQLGTDTVELHPENFRKLMLALAGDVRVILVKVADRLSVMRQLDETAADTRQKIASETALLYAPLAHRMGLYNINSELLDLSLKYNNPSAYHLVFNRLEESKRERELFVAEFVKPIEDKLKAKGFKFKMKARTKAINSIWKKMDKSKISFDEVYDIFAIRVILDSEPENEKSECWQVYSIVTDEYQANPKRMKDWISAPKDNGYESLHATVFGPHEKWVEVQIRTTRMDEVAEKGVAAHWKYKGGTGGANIEKWLAGVREILENPDIDVVDFIDEFNTDVYADEIFVFTPKGDLRRLPAEATLLDFAYEIHSGVGDKCVGGLVDGKKVTLKHKLKNGQQISIDISNNQKPKLDWLDFTVTSKARNRIKASLNEERKREAGNGKEVLLRKLKNWKIDYNDELIRVLLKHYKLKLAQDLYYDISAGKIDTLNIKQVLAQKEEASKENKASQVVQEELSESETKDLKFSNDNDYLIIDNNIKNVTHKLAPCCSPILGDDIFGFVTIKEGIKIHRRSCPNAAQMFERYPYRIIPAKWRGEESNTSFQATIRVSGTDEVGMLSQISLVIAKDAGVSMRSVNIDSADGEFEGTMRVFVKSIDHLGMVIKKLQNIRGIKHVSRTDS